jgi:hypothetical protein
MSLQPAEYWLDMHNTELRLKMAEAERLRRRKEAGVRPARRGIQWGARLAALATRAAVGARRSPAASGTSGTAAAGAQGGTAAAGSRRGSRPAAVGLSPCRD